MATISSLLRERVTLRVRSVDRIFLAGYVPRLQSEGLVVRFLLDRAPSLGDGKVRIPSPALLGKVGQSYVQAIDRFAVENEIPLVRFSKGDCKEELARPYIRAAERAGRFGVVMIGVAQEKARAWRGFRNGGPASHPHFSYRRMSVFVNHYYFYVRDPEWGPASIKTCAYAPYPLWLCLNGHEWAKRQAERRGLSFQALDNGFRSAEDAGALAEICASLSDRHIERFFARWEARLPQPFTAADLRPLRRNGLIRRVPKKPALRADRRRQADRRLLHQDLHANRQPLTRRARPPPTARDRTARTPRARLARIRASPRHPHRRGSHHDLKR